MEERRNKDVVLPPIGFSDLEGTLKVFGTTSITAPKAVERLSKINAEDVARRSKDRKPVGEWQYFFKVDDKGEVLDGGATDGSVFMLKAGGIESRPEYRAVFTKDSPLSVIDTLADVDRKTSFCAMNKEDKPDQALSLLQSGQAQLFNDEVHKIMEIRKEVSTNPHPGKPLVPTELELASTPRNRANTPRNRGHMHFVPPSPRPSGSFTARALSGASTARLCESGANMRQPKTCHAHVAKRKNTVGREQALCELNGHDETLYTLNERTTEFLGKRRDLLAIFYKEEVGWIVTTKAKAFAGDASGHLHKLGNGDTLDITDDELKKAPYVESETQFFSCSNEEVYVLNEKTMEHPERGGLGKSVEALGMFWKEGEGFCVTTKGKAKKHLVDKDVVIKFGSEEEEYLEDDEMPLYVSIENRSVRGEDCGDETIYVTNGINPSDDPFKEKTVYVRYTAAYEKGDELTKLWPNLTKTGASMDGQRIWEAEVTEKVKKGKEVLELPDLAIFYKKGMGWIVTTRAKAKASDSHDMIRLLGQSKEKDTPPDSLVWYEPGMPINHDKQRLVKGNKYDEGRKVQPVGGQLSVFSDGKSIELKTDLADKKINYLSQSEYLDLKAVEASKMPPRKVFHMKDQGRKIKMMLGALAEPAIKKGAIEYWKTYKDIQEAEIAMLSKQWDHVMIYVRKNAEAMDPALRPKPPKKAKKKSKKPPPVHLTPYDIRPKIKGEALERELKTRKEHFSIQVLEWRKDMIKFERFLELNQKKALANPAWKVPVLIKPHRPVWAPVTSWGVMLKAINLAVEGEAKMQALEK